MKKRILFLGMVGVLLSFVSCGKAKEEVYESETKASEEVKIAMVEEGEMAQKPELKYVEGELLVKFKPEVSAEEIITILKDEYQCEIIDIIKGLDVYRIKMPKGKTVPEMVELLSKDERVKYAEPNYIYRLQM
ncbi:MAG: hypothetical protein NC818_00275 [Candidatus Omnitrophica bacterium]|nr:hypothetical protein [Candidatus Omnitrophota bacterium]